MKMTLNLLARRAIRQASSITLDNSMFLNLNWIMSEPPEITFSAAETIFLPSNAA
jgi:hypothetical protein